MKKHLYLHIGIEKTGTTSIQGFLNLNKERLLEKGYLFSQSGGEYNNRNIPSAFMADNRYDDHLNNKGIHSAEDKAAFREETISLLEREVTSSEEKVHSVIISSEHFHSRLMSEKEVASVASELKRVFADISVICYLREQASVCESLYSTAIRCGSTEVFSSFYSKCVATSPYYNYQIFLERWAKHVGHENIVVRLFDKTHFAQGNLLIDFVSSLGVTDLNGLNTEIDRENESISPIGQAIGLAINRMSLNDGLVNSDKMLVMVCEMFRGKGAKIPEDNRLKIYEGFRESNQAVKEKYFPKHEGLDLFVFKSENQYDGDVDELYQSVDLFLRLLIENVSPHFCGSEKLKYFESVNADVFRDAAISMERVNLRYSLTLMECAKILRPDGPKINQKISEYKSRLKMF